MRRGSVAGDTALALSRSAAAALVSVALPLSMAHLLSPTAFAIWTIALQAFLYGSLMEAGMTVAVSRTTAAQMAGGSSSPGLVLRAGFRVALLPVALAVVGYSMLVAVLPMVYANIPDEVVGEARSAVAWMAVASVASLSSLPAQGFLLGAGRFASASVPVALGTAAAAVGAVVAARTGATIAGLAETFALIRVVAALVVMRLARRRAQSTVPPAERGARVMVLVREIRSTVGTMWIWSLAGFLGTGLDITIVSWADYPNVRPYAVAAALTAVLVGVAGAITTVLVPLIARRPTITGGVEQGENERPLWIASWVIACTAIPLAAGGATLSPRLGGRPGITLVLLGGALLRMSLTPFVAAMIAGGDHRLLRVSPLVEGVVNLALGLVLAPLVGAIGVAIATLVSGALGAVMRLAWNFPRSSALSVGSADLLRRLIVPAAIVFAVAAMTGRFFEPLVPAVLATASLTPVGAVVLLFAVTTRQDRRWLRAILPRFPGTGGTDRR